MKLVHGRMYRHTRRNAVDVLIKVKTGWKFYGFIACEAYMQKVLVEA